MRIHRTLLIIPLVFALATPAVAGDLRAEAAKTPPPQAAAAASGKSKHRSPATWAGVGLFAGGMAVALHSFINNKNGSYAEFGEANAVNKKLGAASIGAAFAGGVLIFVGTRRAKFAPDVKAGVGEVTISKQLTW
jgi:hypothetical protein